LSSEYIIPSVFDSRVVEAVSKAVANAAQESGVARRAAAGEEFETPEKTTARL
jgi:malate dehydrogenase (oxaloacetate-decarboxylating)